MKPEQILEFLHYAGKLKDTVRHEWTHKGRQGDVASHSWRLSLIIMMLHGYLDEKVDAEKCIKMAIMHDINEATTGDVPAFLRPQKEEQSIKEGENMEKLEEKYKSEVMNEIVELWTEFDRQKTLEAKFVRACDKLEAWLQHNEGDISKWNDMEFPRSQYIHDKYCEHDKFLTIFKNLVEEESKQKIVNESNYNIDEVIEQAKIWRNEDK